MNQKEDEKYVERTVKTMKALSPQDYAEEIRCIANDLPPSLAFVEKYRELFGDE